MALCTLCRNIPLSASLSTTTSTTDKLSDPSGYDHYNTYDELEISAASCNCCSLIVRTIAKPDGFTFNPNSQSNVRLTISRRSRYGVMSLTAVVVGSKFKATFDIRADRDSLAASLGIIRGRNPLPEANSTEVFSLISLWLNDCLENHNGCRSRRDIRLRPLEDNFGFDGQDKYYPKRVVDVTAIGPTRGVRVLDQDAIWTPKEGYPVYVALSYCWGPSPTLRTTSAALSAHMEGIAFDALPRTLQDAVTITRKLGIQFIWIDALCIVQDDEQDWKREAWKMGYIYENALLTIAATGASNSNQGCFFRRPSDNHPVKIPFRIGPCLEIDSEATLVPSQNCFLTEVIQSPWNSRGWTFQERLLSKRVIHFAKGQIFWECQSLSQGEDCKPIDLNTKRSLMTSLIGTEWEWNRLVEEYTRRKLTKIEDRLSALAGLTTLREAATGADFYGLWRFAFHIGLLWYSSTKEPRRRIENLAPSWSWASIDGPVKWESWVRNAGPVAWMDEMSNPLSLTTRMKPITRSKQLADDSELEYRVTSDLAYDRDLMNVASAVMSADVKDYGTEIGWAVFDELPGEKSSGPRAMLAIQISNNPEAVNEERESHNVLIVEGVGKSPYQRYRRLGMGEIIIEDWFRGGDIGKLVLD